MKRLCLLYFIASCLHIVVCNDMTSSAFEGEQHGILSAFGDFNSDELTDVFMTSENGTLFHILLAFAKEPFLRPSKKLACNYNKNNWTITSVVPGDFDGDAFMDILLTTQNLTTNGTSRSINDIHDIRILWGGEDNLNCSDAEFLKAQIKGHPLAVDYNQDMIIDLFGLDALDNRMFWVFDHNRTEPDKIMMSNERHAEIKLPHSHSVLDMNGDCYPDLVVTTKSYLEVWIGGMQSGFTYSYRIGLPSGYENASYGQALFLDVELTGEFCLLIPICLDVDCRNSTLLLHTLGDEGRWYDLKINLFDETGTLWRFIPPNNETYMETITMRSGDFNMDGYPDILMTMSPINSQDTQIYLLHNTPCSVCEFSRTYRVSWGELNPFGRGTVLGMFYDFDMDGVLDVIAVQKNKTKNNQLTLKALKNNLDYDTNFIKVIVLTGLKNKKVPEMVGTLGKKKGTYGTNLPGPRIAYSTAQGSIQRTGVCAQLPQSAYYSLYLPYSIFGLDRTPNFVDSLTISMLGYYKKWTQIIPNSQMVVIPYPLNDPASWKAQLFVTPSKLIVKSLCVLTAILVIIVSLIGHLHFKEKREDRRELLENNDF